MKRPKPGFRVFIKTRIKHPLKSLHKLIFTDAAGIRYKDTGSIHTALFGGVFWISFFFLQISLRFTLWAYVLGALLPILHRFLRYFWTDFAGFDRNGDEIENKSLLFRKVLPISSMFLNSDNVEYEQEGDCYVKYERYGGWRKALITLEAVLLICLPFAALAFTIEAPYSRFAVNTDEYEMFATQNNVDTLSEAYGEARLLIGERCPEAELIDLAAVIDLRDTERMSLKQELFRNTYIFTFRNPERGVFIHNTDEIIVLNIHGPGGIAMFDFSDATWEQAGVKALKEPVDADSARIRDIALGAAGISEEDAESIVIRPGSVSSVYYDPGGETWEAGIQSVGGEQYYYIVDAAKGTAIKRPE